MLYVLKTIINSNMSASNVNATTADTTTTEESQQQIVEDYYDINEEDVPSLEEVTSTNMKTLDQAATSNTSGQVKPKQAKKNGKSKKEKLQTTTTKTVNRVQPRHPLEWARNKKKMKKDPWVSLLLKKN